MHKFILMLTTTVLFYSISFAQGEAPLSKGEKQLNFGLTGLDDGSLPVYAGLDFAIHDDITLGPKVAADLFDGNNGFLKVGFVANYHWNKLIGIPRNWDFYAGLNAAMRLHFDSSKDADLDFGGQLGGRWFFTEKWALNVEAGFSGAIGGGAGLTLRF